MSDAMTNLHDQNLPEDLRTIGAAVDRLGARERDAAPAGLEERLFAASRSRLGAAPAVVARIGPRTAAWRLAAGIAVAGVTAAAAMWMLRGSPSGPTGGVVAQGPVSGGAAAALATDGPRLDGVLDELAAAESAGVWSLDDDISAIDSELLALESDVTLDWDDDGSSLGEDSL
jgi:hypothetical protein